MVQRPRQLRLLCVADAVGITVFQYFSTMIFFDCREVAPRHPGSVEDVLTGATAETHHFSSEVSSIRELKTSLKSCFGERKMKLLPPDERSHCLGTPRESWKNKWGVFSDDFG